MKGVTHRFQLDSGYPRNLVRTRFFNRRSLLTLPLESPLELPLRVLFLERDVDSLLENLSHVLQRILDSEHFGQSLELLLEVAVGGKAEIENVRAHRFEEVRRWAVARQFLDGRCRAGQHDLFARSRSFMLSFGSCFVALQRKLLADRWIEDGLRPELDEIFIDLSLRHSGTISKKLHDIVLAKMGRKFSRDGEA